MTHPSEMISAYLDGELNDRERSDLMRHLAVCGRCSAELGEVQRVRAAIRSLPVLELPQRLVPGADPVVVPLRSHKGVWAGVAAAVLVIVVTVAALVTPPASVPTVDQLNSTFGARETLNPAFGPAKVVVPTVEGME